VICGSLTQAARDYVNSYCSVYWGWRDNCDGCQSEPVRWGSISEDACHDGSGFNSCQTKTLGSQSVRLFGLDMGTFTDVDGNDKFYIGMRCTAPPPSSVASQCPAGQFVTGVGAGGTVQCGGIGSAAKTAINDNCRLYAGWSDDCYSDCTTPQKWGYVTNSSCAEYGSDNTCTAPTLNGKAVRLLGLNPDGDVDGNDKFFLGTECVGITVGPAGDCPAGQLAVGVSGGAVQCAPVAGALQAYVADKCSLYLGWRDHCNGCTEPPDKWGRVSQNSCQNGDGSNNTCTTALLDNDIVKLFGLNPDGDVDGNDKLFYGFRCE
jgi:hypothetical protein